MGGDSGGPGYDGPGDEGTREDDIYEITVWSDVIKNAPYLGGEFSKKSALILALSATNAAMIGTVVVWSGSAGAFSAVRGLVTDGDDTLGEEYMWGSLGVAAEMIMQAWRDPPRWDFATLDRPPADPHRKGGQAPVFFENQRTFERIFDLTRQFIFRHEKMEGAQLAGDSGWAAYHRGATEEVLRQMEALVAALPAPDPAKVRAVIDQYAHLDPVLAVHVRALAVARGYGPPA